ncbi:hypothetical protein GCM10010195_64540 [Kitasatospora griseola]|nr:hypothetical protein GCM10010195_64540 [Kitasatospora griseola]
MLLVRRARPGLRPAARPRIHRRLPAPLLLALLRRVRLLLHGRLLALLRIHRRLRLVGPRLLLHRRLLHRRVLALLRVHRRRLLLHRGLLLRDLLHRLRRGSELHRRREGHALPVGGRPGLLLGARRDRRLRGRVRRARHRCGGRRNLRLHGLGLRLVRLRRGRRLLDLRLHRLLLLLHRGLLHRLLLDRRLLHRGLLLDGRLLGRAGSGALGVPGRSGVVRGIGPVIVVLGRVVADVDAVPIAAHWGSLVLADDASAVAFGQQD